MDITSIKGFLSEKEGERLRELAKQASRLGPCLEIGSYCGKSAAYIGSGCKETGGVLFSIDHHRGSEEQQPGEEYFDPELFDERYGKVDTFRFFRETVEKMGLEDTVIPIVSVSSVVARFWNTPLSMVFIDGGHSYDTVFTDYNCWAHHIIPGGYLAIHDIFLDPSKGGQAPYKIYKLALASGLFKEMPMVETLGVLIRLRPGEKP